MMDTQRLIALVVFAFSALLLWEAWQKHNAPRQMPVPTTTAPAAPSAPATPGAPAAAAPAPAPSAGAPMPAAPSTTAVQQSGEPVTVKTDVFDVEINTLGGDIRRVTMKQHHSALDRSQPLTLME